MPDIAKSFSIMSNGIRLQAYTSGEGPPLLFLHGMWCDHLMFARLFPEFHRYHQVIALDFRGHGRSETPERSWSVMDLTDDIVAAMDAFSLEKAVLAGHSLGGMAALHMAFAVPRRVSGLVLMGASADAELPQRKPQLEALRLAIRLTGLRKWMLQHAAESFFTPVFRQRHPGRVAAWCRGVRAMPKRALVQALQAVTDRPTMMERLGDIDAPALVLCGENDTIADPGHTAAMADRLPGGTHRILPRTGHALPIERPQELAEAMLPFLSAHIPGGTLP